MQNNIEKTMAAIEYIEGHLTEKIDLEAVAQAAHYSKYHLHRIFTATSGMTIHDYIKRRQLTEAARLLVFSNCSIMDISLASGYESRQAFTDSFRSMYKKSPGEYREAQMFYPLQLPFRLELQPRSFPKGAELGKKVSTASDRDIPKWMALLPFIVDGLPCLNQAEYLQTLKSYIHSSQAFILNDGELAAGVIGVNRKTGVIDFFGIHPQSPKQEVARALLKKAASVPVTGIKLSVTTFRKNDRADPGYRSLFLSLGFTEAELVTEYGYPNQRLLYRGEAAGNGCTV